MRIHRMQASFGCLRGETLELKPGFNLIEAPNESGKSTWCAFLLAMLYGINTRERDKKGLPSEKTRFRPWDGAPLEGRLDCEYQGRRVILRRSSEGGIPFGSFSAVWAESGQQIPELTGENVGQALTGVGREVFERSVLFRQGSMEVGQSRELEQRIASLLSSGEEQTSWTQADRRLREWQRSRRYHKKGALPQLEEEQAERKRRIEQVEALMEEGARLQREIEAQEQTEEKSRTGEPTEHTAYRAELERRWAAAAAELDAAQLQLQALGEEALPQTETEEETRSKRSLEERMRRRNRRFLTGAGAGLLAALLLLLAAWRQWLLPGVAYGLLCFVVLLVLGGNLLRARRARRDRQARDRLAQRQKEREETLAEQVSARAEAQLREARAQERYTALTRELNTSSQRSEAARLSMESVAGRKEELARLGGRLQELGDLETLRAEWEEKERLRLKLEQEYRAIELALGALERADRLLRERFSPALNARTAQYFARLTEGAYETVLFDRDFTAQAEQAGSPVLRSSLLLSRGTLDQLYLALRLAICELVLPEERALPLFFDDALAAFDDRRAGLALRLLQELSHGRQIVFFTCQSREGRLLSRLGEPER